MGQMPLTHPLFARSSMSVNVTNYASEFAINQILPNLGPQDCGMPLRRCSFALASLPRRSLDLCLPVFFSILRVQMATMSGRLVFLFNSVQITSIYTSAYSTERVAHMRRLRDGIDVKMHDSVQRIYREKDKNFYCPYPSCKVIMKNSCNFKVSICDAFFLNFMLTK